MNDGRKYCTGCKHVVDAADAVRCGHPNVAIDMVGGGKRPRSAMAMRELDGPCGPEGRLWEPRGVVDPPPPQRHVERSGDEPPERYDPIVA